jgi:hypothetical protein
MTKPFALPPLRRGRGNPNWGKPLDPLPESLTEFETEAARLGLTISDYVASVELKRWCAHNRNRVYVPEWLLTEWEMHVEIGYSLVSGGS